MRKPILIRSHPFNLDQAARIVMTDRQGTVYAVSDGKYVATVNYPYCLEGTFESVGEANKAIEDYYGDDSINS